MPQAILCAFGLVGSASVGLWFLYAGPVATSEVQASLPPRMALGAAARLAQPASSRIPAKPNPSPHLTWFDPALTTATLADTFEQVLPLGSDFQPLQAPARIEAPAPDDAAEADSAASQPPAAPLPVIVAEVAREIPLPLPRPAFSPVEAPARPHEMVQSRRDMALLAPQPDAAPPGTITNPGNFFQRVFGEASQRGPALAYAAPDEDGIGPALLARTAPDRWTAVYNIATHTVTLPNGAQLEAHSGLGSRLDDPRSVTEHMRGATPPNTYDLTLREAPFHGVRALRLTPTGGTTYGRAGLLAHTFMLGPRGDSNGCVVFRNYAAFLQAYETGVIRRLVVVTGAS